MGQALAEQIQAQADLSLCGIWRRGEDLAAYLGDADVLIDFSLPDAADEILKEVQARSLPLVCGVSGLQDAQMQRLREVASAVPLVYDRNMSLGIAVLERSVREAAASLGQDFSIAVSDVHHVHKKDSPSGTALKLGEAMAAARGETGTGSVRFAAERRGEVPGEHEIVMQSATETVVFAHRVTTRQVFVDGALRAARWVVGQGAGLYSMQNVLFSDRAGQ